MTAFRSPRAALAPGLACYILGGRSVTNPPSTSSERTPDTRTRVKTIAISQSNYIPWKGYFDMIARVDEFVVYDEVQFTKNDWRNRNQIKTPKGVEWLSI